MITRNTIFKFFGKNKFLASKAVPKKILAIFLTLIGLASGFKAQAQLTYDWVGGSSTSWTAVANWRVSGVQPIIYPGQSANNDIVNIGNGTAFTNQPTLNVSGRTIGQLNMGSSASVTLNLSNGSLSVAATTGLGAVNGAVNINGNTVTLNNNSLNCVLLNIAAGTFARGNVAVTASGAITVTGTSTVSGASNLTGGSLTTANSGTTFSLNSPFVSSTGTITIADNTTITKDGTGTVSAASLTTGASTTFTLGNTATFSGAITVNGNTTVSGSTLQGATLTTTGTAILTANGPLTVTGLTSLGANTSITKGATGVFTGNTLTTAATSAISLSNNATFSGAITINGNTTFSGGSTIQGATLTTANTSTALTANSPITITGLTTVAANTSITKGSGNVFTGNTLTTAASSGFAANGNSTFSGAITVNGSTTFSGTATLQGATLTTANNSTVLTANGALTITGATSIVANTSIVKGATGVFTGNSTLAMAAGSTLTLNNAATLTGAISVNGNATIDGGSLLSGPNFTVAASTTATLNTPLTCTNGAITLNGSSVLISSAAGVVNAGTLTTAASTLTMAGAQTYTGAVAINGNTTISGGGLLKCTTYTVANSITNLLNTPLTPSGTITLNSSAVLTGGSVAVITGTSVNLNASSALTIGANSTLTGAINISGTASSLTLSGNLSSTGIAFSQNSTFGIAAGSGKTLTLGGALAPNNTNTLTIGASNFITCSNIDVGQNSVFTNGSTITSSGAFSASGNTTTLTNSGSISCTTVGLGQNTTLTNSGTIAASSSITTNGNSNTVTNTGTITTASSLDMGSNTVINNNAGSVFTVASNLTLGSGNGTQINNLGTFTHNAGTLTLNQNTQINANGGTFTTSATSIPMGGPAYITANSGGTFNANGANANITWGQNAIVRAYAGGTINISNGAVLNLSAGPSYITNEGTFRVGVTGSPGCTINMSGQNSILFNQLSTGAFYLGPGTVLNLNGQVTCTNSSPGVFTYQSDATGSAALASVNGQATINGQYAIERFFTGGASLSNRGYRMVTIASNQTGTTGAGASTSNSSTFNLNSIKNGVFVGGPGTGFSTGGTNANPSIYFYNETFAANNISFTTGKFPGVYSIGSSNVVLTHTSYSSNLTTTIPIGNGFMLYYVGPGSRTTGSSTGGAPADGTMSTIGYINQGTIRVKLWFQQGNSLLSYTSGLGATSAGFCMVGNPYPSTLNLQQLLADNNDATTGITAVYVLNSRAGGTNQNFIAYTPLGNSSPLLQGYAVSGGGFIVKAASNTAFLEFRESQKVPTTQLTGSGLIMSAPKADVLALDGKLGNATASLSQSALMALPPQLAAPEVSGLYMKMEKDTSVYDYTGIYFRSGYKAKFDDNDAIYMPGPTAAVSMASLSSDGLKTAVNLLPDYHPGALVKLNVNATTTGLYNLKLEGVKNIDDIYDIYLLDHYKKDSLDIRRYGAYAFNINRADTATYGSYRFELSIRLKPLPQYLLTNFAGAKATEGVNVTWKTVNESNYTGFTLEKLNAAGTTYADIYDKQSDGSATYAYIDHAPTPGLNTYRLKQNDVYGRISYTEPITIFYDKLAGNGLLNVFPNPTAQMINVSIPGNMAAPSYKLKVYNSAGNVVMQQTSTTQYWTQSVAGLQTGVYIVQVAKSDGTELGKVKFVKQ